MSTLTIGNVQIGNAVGATPPPSGAEVADAVTLLMAPEASLAQSGDPAAMLAVLTLKTGKMERRAHTAMRRSEEAIQDKAESAQVSALRDKADDVRTGALVSGLTTIGSAFAKGAGSSAGEAASKAAGEVIGGIYKGAETLEDARAAEAEHIAGHAKRAGEDERDAIKDAKDLVDKALEFYKEYSTGRNQAMAAATHRA